VLLPQAPTTRRHPRVVRAPGTAPFRLPAQVVSQTNRVILSLSTRTPNELLEAVEH
jgi:hypothetical protein